LLMPLGWATHMIRRESSADKSWLWQGRSTAVVVRTLESDWTPNPQLTPKYEIWCDQSLPLVNTSSEKGGRSI
jgi:hypothetical protein